MYPFLALVLVILLIEIPDHINWVFLLFLSMIAVIDRLNTKAFSSFSYSFSTVILGLLIFDPFSIWRCLIYFLFSFLTLWIKRKPNFLFVFLPLLSIQVLVIIIGNEFYNVFTDKDYLARYMTLVVLLGSNVILYYLAVAMETGRFSTSILLSIFGPVVFELIIVFPVLSLFNDFSYIFIVGLIISYYLFIGILHKKYLTINDQHVQALTQKLNSSLRLEVMFMDIGELKGICYPRKKMIIIDSKMDFPEQMQTLIHEWIHFRLWKKHKLVRPIEEFVVTILEAIISWYYILTIQRADSKK